MERREERRGRNVPRIKGEGKIKKGGEARGERGEKTVKKG